MDHRCNKWILSRVFSSRILRTKDVCSLNGEGLWVFNFSSLLVPLPPLDLSAFISFSKKKKQEEEASAWIPYLPPDRGLCSCDGEIVTWYPATLSHYSRIQTKFSICQNIYRHTRTWKSKKMIENKFVDITWKNLISKK